jgi:Protein of unknown function (DUF1761)
MDLTALEAKLKAMGLELPAQLAHYASQINSAAVLAALIAGWVVGWIYYGLVGNLWKESAATSDKGGGFTPRRQIFGGIAQVIMTIMLGSFMQRLNYMGPYGGVHTAWLLWLGFVMTTILVNYANLGKRLGLALIDSVHWLLVLTVMGLIIGSFNLWGIGTAPMQAAAPAQPAAVTTTTGG